MLQRNFGILLAKISKFFEHSTVDAFSEKRSAIIGTKHMCPIYKAIFEVIAQDFLLYVARADDDKDIKGPPPGNAGVNVFVLQYMVTNGGVKVIPCNIYRK